MKKLLWIAVLVAVAFAAYKKRHVFLGRDGAFDNAGNPIVRLFVGPGCGQACADVEAELTRRNVTYEVLDVSTPAGQEYGIRQYPLTMVGRGQVLGNRIDGIVGLLAENYGGDVLTPSEQNAMAGHFDSSGKPVVVLYGTQWCGYCKRQRQFFADNGIVFNDVDVEVLPEGKRAYDTLRGQGYPLLYVGYRRFEGYKEAEIKAAIAELM
jgi:glutaredoxin